MEPVAPGTWPLVDEGLHRILIFMSLPWRADQHRGGKIDCQCKDHRTRSDEKEETVVATGAGEGER